MPSVATLLTTTLLGFGTLGPIPGEERFASSQEASGKQTVSGGLGFLQIDEDYFAQLQLRTELNLGMVGLGLQVPLNLRVMDNDPKQSQDDYYGVIRREDWDQPTDFIKVLRYVRVGHKRDPLYVRVGELASELGHGTIMSRYLNNLDVNNFRVGAQLDVNTKWAGLETVVSDFGAVFDGATGSRILGSRLYVKPVAFYDADSVFNIFKLGLSLVSDVNAPLRFATDPATGENVVEDDRLVVARDSAQTVWGMDLEAEVLHSAMLDVVPYTDLNFVQGGGWGWHLGTLVTAKMPIGIELQIPVRLEYRRFRSDYVPVYFGTFYEVERYDYALGAAGGPAPKAHVVRELDDGDGINGYYADLAFDFAGLLQIGAVYEDYDKADPNLAVFLSVPALEVVQFKAYYTRRGITGTDDIFVFDDRSLAIAQARYQLSAFMYAVARFTRQWELDPTTGTYDSVDSWNAGLEFSLEL